ncbi:MAG: hypothetical protein WC615_04855 [Mucilaginibacter sp.]|jgi:hypothetical protein|uniref:hypothetical protein n=1 Tax=Mucilaginibacter sp. TaxID=1882438 RepID=UPI00356609C0
MKEISEVNEIPITTPTYSKVYPISKRWKKVSKLSHANNHKQLIDTRIIQYECVLRKVKELYANSGETCYERDYKHDNENPFTIYSFLTSTFWWDIECDFVYQINIVYQFENSPHEDAIRALFREFHLTPYITEVAKQPSLAGFHKAVLAYQKSQFIHTL